MIYSLFSVIFTAKDTNCENFIFIRKYKDLVSEIFIEVFLMKKEIVG